MANQSLSESLCITLSHSPIVYHQSHNHIFSYCHVSVSALTILYLLQDNLSLVSCLHHYPLYTELSASSSSLINLFRKHYQWRLASRATHVGSSSHAFLLSVPLHWLLLLLPSPHHPASRLVSSTTNGLVQTHTHMQCKRASTEENLFTARLVSRTNVFLITKGYANFLISSF